MIGCAVVCGHFPGPHFFDSILVSSLPVTVLKSFSIFSSTVAEPELRLVGYCGDNLVICE